MIRKMLIALALAVAGFATPAAAQSCMVLTGSLEQYTVAVAANGSKTIQGGGRVYPANYPCYRFTEGMNFVIQGSALVPQTGNPVDAEGCKVFTGLPTDYTVTTNASGSYTIRTSGKTTVTSAKCYLFTGYSASIRDNQFVLDTSLPAVTPTPTTGSSPCTLTLNGLPSDYTIVEGNGSYFVRPNASPTTLTRVSQGGSLCFRSVAWRVQGTSLTPQFALPGSADASKEGARYALTQLRAEIDQRLAAIK